MSNHHLCSTSSVWNDLSLTIGASFCFSSFRRQLKHSLIVSYRPFNETGIASTPFQSPPPDQRRKLIEAAALLKRVIETLEPINVDGQRFLDRFGVVGERLYPVLKQICYADFVYSHNTCLSIWHYLRKCMFPSS